MNGFSLLEILIALTLLSFSTLSFLQQRAKINYLMQQAYDRHVALQQSLSFMERLHANSDVEYRTREVQEWHKENATLLPQDCEHRYASRRHYERSEAIQNVSASWIASLRSQ